MARYCGTDDEAEAFRLVCLSDVGEDLSVRFARDLTPEEKRRLEEIRKEKNRLASILRRLDELVNAEGEGDKKLELQVRTLLARAELLGLREGHGWMSNKLNNLIAKYSVKVISAYCKVCRADTSHLRDGEEDYCLRCDYGNQGDKR